MSPAVRAPVLSGWTGQRRLASSGLETFLQQAQEWEVLAAGDVGVT